MAHRVSRRTLLGSGLATAGTTLALSNVASAASPTTTTTTAPIPPTPTTGQTKEYWIVAESFRHNLVPTGKDLMMGMTFKPKDSSYTAIGFRAYTPGWKAPIASNLDIGPNTGIPGPIIRANVGDTVLVHFKNLDHHYKWPHSMHTHGFRYTPASDGAYIQGNGKAPGTAVAYGDHYTYTWTALPSSEGTWLYHDHSVQEGLTKAGPVMEMGAELGMFGMVAVTSPTTPPVDVENFVFFHDLYQADVPELAQDFDCFNGQAYLGNTQEFTAKVGQKVRWRVAALGKEFHVFHIHGHRWAPSNGTGFVDSQILGPSTTLTVEYEEDNPGSWLYHCHVTDHTAGGMVGSYVVTI
ncbi:MAG TPA: multicopper oxidase domain-containing protein [Acidimicrobiales bacterium]